MIKKTLIAVAIVVALLGGTAYLFKGYSPLLFGKSEYVKVASGSIDVTLTFQGELSARGAIPIVASPLIKGKGDVVGALRIKSMVPEGKYVRQGEVVATLDRQPIAAATQAAVAEAQSLRDQAQKAATDTTTQFRDARYNLSSLRINMEISQINMEQSLYDPPAAQRKAKLEFEKSKIAYDQAYQGYLQRKLQAEANINSLRASAERADKRVADVQKLMGITSVRAPRAGVVAYATSLSGEKRGVGSVITPDDLTVALIPDQSSFYSTAQLEEDDVARIKVGQAVRVKIKILDSKAYDGTVAEVGGIPALRDGKKFYTIGVRLRGNLAELRPLMTTINEVDISQLPNVRYLPKQAVATENGASYVYTKDRRKVRVELGGANSENVAILSGLELGEEVYLNRPSNASQFVLVNR